jgi:putative hydrolase of the HAD superfamily
LSLDDALLDELLRIEQEAWWQGARVDPEAIPLLDVLRSRGVRTGVCSNAPYRARSLHEQVAFLGLDTHLDAVTFSVDVGWRKPATRMFDAALHALGTPAGRTVMVGDREATDIAGAHAAGMRAVLINRRGEHGASGADAEIAALRELPGALRDMGIYWV